MDSGLEFASPINLRSRQTRQWTPFITMRRPYRVPLYAIVETWKPNLIRSSIRDNAIDNVKSIDFYRAKINLCLKVVKSCFLTGTRCFFSAHTGWLISHEGDVCGWLRVRSVPCGMLREKLTLDKGIDQRKKGRQNQWCVGKVWEEHTHKSALTYVSRL